MKALTHHGVVAALVTGYRECLEDYLGEIERLADEKAKLEVALGVAEKEKTDLEALLSEAVEREIAVLAEIDNLRFELETVTRDRDILEEATETQ